LLVGVEDHMLVVVEVQAVIVLQQELRVVEHLLNQLFQ
jgi:hypothetical protein